MTSRYTLLLIFSILFLGACGGNNTPGTPPPPTLDAQAQMGKQVFSAKCGACHSTSPETIIVGPSLAGIANRADGRVANQDAYTYLLTSIMQPDDYLVEGYENLMPASLAKELTGEEIDGVVAYLQTLK